MDARVRRLVETADEVTRAVAAAQLRRTTSVGLRMLVRNLVGDCARDRDQGRSGHGMPRRRQLRARVRSTMAVVIQ